MSCGNSYRQYVNQLIPLEHRWKLKEVLDYHNDYDTDLIEIAKHIIDWEVKLASPLQLTPVEVHDIKEKRNTPMLTRREVLRVWKSKNMLNATYGLLLKKCLEGGDARTAQNICMLLAENQSGGTGEHGRESTCPAVDQEARGHAESQNGTCGSRVPPVLNGSSVASNRVKPVPLWDRDSTLSCLQLIKYVHRMTGSHEQLKILTELAPDWKDIATSLGFSNTFIRTTENPGSGRAPQDCLRMVIGSWLDDSLRMKYPGTWRGIHQLLLDSSLSKLAEKLQAAVEAEMSTLHHNYVRTEEEVLVGTTVTGSSSISPPHGASIPGQSPGVLQPGANVPSSAESSPSQQGQRPKKLNYEELATWLNLQGIDPQDIEIIKGAKVNELLFLTLKEDSPKLRQVSQVTKDLLPSVQDSLKNR